MKIIGSILILCIVPWSCFSQISESIRAGRPGQAIGPFNVYKKILQFQQGLEYSYSSEPFTKSDQFFNSNTIRFGLGERLEINSGIDHGFARVQQDGTPSVSNYGLNGWWIGSRINIIKKPQKFVPALGLQTSIIIPSQMANAKINNFGAFSRLVFLFNLSENWTLILNNQITLPQFDQNPYWSYIVNLGFSVNDKTALFTEYYGDNSNGLFSSNLDGGFSFLPTDNLQLDLYGGGSLTHGEINYFISSGLSWRLNLKNKN